MSRIAVVARKWHADGTTSAVRVSRGGLQLLDLHSCGGDDGTRTHDPLLANCDGTARLQGRFRVSAGSWSVEYRRRSPSTARFSSVVARKWHDPTPLSRSRSATRSSGVERHFDHTENLDVTESRSLS